MAQNEVLKIKHRIRSRLLSSYAIVIVVFGVVLAGFVTVHFTVVNNYKALSDTMITEYRLLEEVPRLIGAYNDAFKSLGSDNTIDTTRLDASKVELHRLLGYLDVAIVDENSINDYVGLKNTIYNLESEIDKGLSDLRSGKVNVASSYYDAAKRQQGFVQSNVTTLIVDQLKYMDSLQKQIDDTYRVTAYLATGIGVATLAAVIFYVVSFARKLTVPLQRLNRVAQRIAAGSKSTRVPVELTRGEDEISSLGRSFSVMLEKLLESNTRHDALLVSIGDGVVATDANGTVDYLNTAAQKLFKLTEDEAIGQQYSQLWVVEDNNKQQLETSQRPIYKALHEGTSVSDSSFYYARKTETGDQVRFPVATSVSPIKVDNQTIGIVAVFRDITREKEVDRMKTEFISLASHQLKTPLSAINWFGEMLASGDAGALNDDQKEFVESIRGSTRRMTDLVNALLNISRIEAGRIIVEPIPTNLKALVRGVVDDLKAKSVEKQHTMTIEVQQEIPEISIDPHLIGQVYMNLLSNAIKYTPQNGKIDVSVVIDGDKVVSRISDNGYGIPKEGYDKMFQKFFRADNVAKVEIDGTGLGLYLVKSIVESCGGTIWFESEINKGTTFWFTMPLSGMTAKAGDVSLVPVGTQ